MQNFRLQQSNTSNQAMFSTTIRRIMKSQKKKKKRKVERGKEDNQIARRENKYRDIRSKKEIFIRKGKVEAEKCSIGHQYKKEI